MTSNPKPGSDEAIEAGCLCAVHDNAHSAGYKGIEGVYVIESQCPVHSNNEPPSCCHEPQQRI